MVSEVSVVSVVSVVSEVSFDSPDAIRCCYLHRLAHATSASTSALS